MGNGGSKNIRVVSAIAVILLAAGLSCRSKKDPNSATDNQNASAVVGGLSSIKEYEKIEDKSKAIFDHSSQSHKAGPNEIIKDCNFCHRRAESDPTDLQVKHSPPHNVFAPYHDSCEPCHRKEKFSEEFKKGTINSHPLCGICHEENAGGILDTSSGLLKFFIKGYPEKQGQFGLAGLSNDGRGFSHKDHLDPQKMGADAELAKCSTCHKATDAVRLNFPKHGECFLCHTHQAGQKLDECGVCHTVKANAVIYSADMGAAFSSYNFKHGAHIKKASCEKCHRIEQARFGNLYPDVVKISTPRGRKHNSACWDCHIRAREPFCTKCHVGSLPF